MRLRTLYGLLCIGWMVATTGVAQTSTPDIRPPADALSPTSESSAAQWGSDSYSSPLPHTGTPPKYALKDETSADEKGGVGKATPTASASGSSSGSTTSGPSKTSTKKPVFPTATSFPPQFPNSNYAQLLNYSLLFFEAQKAGKLPPGYRIPWRQDSVLDDGRDEGVDLSGGFFDAGNHLKFTLPLAYTLSFMAWGALDSWEGYALAGQMEWLRDVLKWGADWLVKAHPKPNVLFVQVGDGHVDNGFFGKDVDIPKPRPAFKVDEKNHGTDVAAGTAAAFASVAMVFRDLFNETEYADLLLKHAEEVYNFAEMEPYTFYSDSVPQARDFYRSWSYKDELVWGALWLWHATKNESYQYKASNYFDVLEVGGSNFPVDWSDLSGACYVFGAQADPNNTKYRREAERYLEAKVALQDGKCRLTRGGLLWCGVSSDHNSVMPALNTAWLLANYAERVDKSKQERYYAFARSQWDYVLGDNPMNMPYVCGVHKNSPMRPHHAGSHGGLGIQHINDPAPNKNILYGAVVGGPGENDFFEDSRTNYKESEVAIDYQAAFQNLVAFSLRNGTADPFYVHVTADRPSSPDDLFGGKLPAWAIALIVIACVLVAGMAAGGFVWWRVVRRRRMAKSYEMEVNGTYTDLKSVQE
ncbi:uncharacterized protein VTP21DRAFT_5408 [Calcarisporiella thermophila]|uniref:uncharacterized protein n=1 Tax=Calcarisporiella thermophila TaxID=911321 RepID=UPI00374312CD